MTTIFNPFLIIGPEYVPFEDVPYYYSVSDIALIQRKHILNSGNVPMAFLFGKVVVGPDVGNVGQWLQETGNPTFDPSNPDSLVNAVKEAEELIKNGVGERNKEYALTQLDPEMIAGQYQNLYRSVFMNKG